MNIKITLQASIIFFVLLVDSFASDTSSSPIPSEASLNFTQMLQPVPEHAVFKEPGYNVWCGTVAKGDDGQYHLFYSRWKVELGHKAWVTHSEVAHAIGASPFGPFKFSSVIIPPRGKLYWDGDCTHNPTVIRSKGKYYLYYMGNYGDGTYWVNRNNQRIGVAVADKPEGPWTRFDKPLIDISADAESPDAKCVANPSVVERPEGGFLMVYKSVAAKGNAPFFGPVHHLVATSDFPTGPFIKNPNPVFIMKETTFAAEDPFIWYQEGYYRAIVKDMKGVFTNQGTSLAHFESKDGVEWFLSHHTLVSKLNITWETGKSQAVSALERPQIYLENGKLVALLCAVAETVKRDNSYNIQIPLKLTRL